MNHTVLKNYAPQARRDFIQAVTDRAAFYGITAAKIEPVTEQGDVAIIGGRPFPASVVAKRKKLLNRIERDGFNQTMETLAYTWFNRFVALRFMELHGYLEHGYRVLSHPDPAKKIPEILEFAERLDLPSLNKEKVIDLKLDSNKESELYSMLLLAQCHALHSAMPFLFEGIDDETELVLPENLLHSDSIIRKLVASSDAEDWREVEVLGWLYQFYISERKDEVMARKIAVPTEDIPAVTQLFTPHWIVRYLVENSLGRLWVLNRPGSKLREHMPYYIEGAAESDFLKIIKPEEIRLLDPACGSGHMLTYAFDLLFLIYEEEGYVPSDIPALILLHNLYGLEICPRAAQLANLALVLKAREKSRRFIRPHNLVQPHVLALQNVHFDDGELGDYIAALDLGDLFNQPMLRLLKQFEEATTFGSLIQPSLDEAGIAYARRAIDTKDLGGRLFLRDTHAKVLLVLEQAEMLCQRYHVVVANPPYMGNGTMNVALKDFAKEHFPTVKADLFAMFIIRCLDLTNKEGSTAMITMQSWMFLSSYEQLRLALFENSFSTLIHIGYNTFPELNSKIAQGAAFVLIKRFDPSKCGAFIDLNSAEPSADKHQVFLEKLLKKERFAVANRVFMDIPGHPIAYWTSESLRSAYRQHSSLKLIGDTRQGMATSDNGRFLRLWYEVALNGLEVGCNSRAEAITLNAKWIPYNKGGETRKWWGNQDHVIDWRNDGESVISYAAQLYGSPTRTIKSLSEYFKACISWSKISWSVAFRYFPNGFIFDVAGCCIFFKSNEELLCALSFLNSRVTEALLAATSPTLNFEAGHVAAIPFDLPSNEIVVTANETATHLISIARADWDNFETSWDFRDQPLLRSGPKGATLEASWRNWEAQSTAVIHRTLELETENNRLWIAAYGLDGELQPEVFEEQITLARADTRRDMAAFLSYAVGCMMGRYSLDQPGLILADAGMSLADYLAKVGKQLDALTFSPDEDGIIPVLNGEWFEDDIVARTRDFLRTTFDDLTLEANLRFIEESLGKDLHKYFLTDFYKDHLRTYKKRPIYWLFSSGKERAFQALVYLHRYHEGSLSRMRTEYVIPLQGKIASRVDQLAGDIQKAASTSHRKKMEKERDSLLRQRTELQAFDEKLRHYADQRIQLDLDDGVKVNYGKFGELLAEVKAVTGGSDE